MPSITLVTGNPNKLREYKALLPNHTDLVFTSHALDLHEIQSIDPHEVVKDKLFRAYEILKKPIVVEDVSAGLKSLGGLPGTFIKFFEEGLGNDALYQLSKVENDEVTVLCLAAYYDGEKMIFGEGKVTATLVAPRGKNGFGFDSVMVYPGETRTVSEMSPEEKNARSHRYLAIRSLLEQISKE